MSNLITYNEAVILHKHGVDVIMSEINHTPEHWQSFSPSCKDGWVFKKKFETINLQVKSAIPVNTSIYDEFYTLQVVVQRCKKSTKGFEPCEDLIRSDYIASFETHEAALSVAHGLIWAYGGVK